ncbi:bZIP transcription factor 44-like [Dioscorea cayenensis subsp. rotundata]|uniref:BZIP transcription factor 44-like n=1 Tax=Dioscorea cayennensis subsp. rotundata TaxID=55577 RepID=A0AB40CAP8_DIOCR|nr:bZIP transcription factor 44-like [Dioscorea cayenensis subsp. rotundata]
MQYSQFNSILTQSLPTLEPGFGFTPWVSTNPSPIENKTQTQTQTYSFSGSDGPARPGLSPVDDRRLRRKISNRESARRSRMRKQRHLEDLRIQASRLRSENRELASRLGAVTHNCFLFRRESERLSTEATSLCLRLSEIRRFLLSRQLQRLSSPAAALMCGGGFVSGSAQTGSSIIA